MRPAAWLVVVACVAAALAVGLGAAPALAGDRCGGWDDHQGRDDGRVSCPAPAPPAPVAPAVVTPAFVTPAPDPARAGTRATSGGAAPRSGGAAPSIPFAALAAGVAAALGGLVVAGFRTRGRLESGIEDAWPRA